MLLPVVLKLCTNFRPLLFVLTIIKQFIGSWQLDRAVWELYDRHQGYSMQQSSFSCQIVLNFHDEMRYFLKNGDYRKD